MLTEQDRALIGRMRNPDMLLKGDRERILALVDRLDARIECLEAVVGSRLIEPITEQVYFNPPRPMPGLSSIAADEVALEMSRRAGEVK